MVSFIIDTVFTTYDTRLLRKPMGGAILVKNGIICDHSQLLVEYRGGNDYPQISQ